jgi:hypothetical protein
MSIPKALPSKTSGISSVRPSLPTLPKFSSRLQTKRSTVPSKTEIQIQLSSIPNQEDLDDIVNNLSTIVKQSEQLLTPDKSSHTTATVRRTSSLHITNRQNLSNSFVKTSNSHYDTFTDSNLDISRLNTQRRSIRNVEKFSGIKCSLPTGRSTIPHAFKGLDKHRTPTKPKQANNSSSSIDHQITPTVTNDKVKSPWRLRFEKFVNHQDLTPLSPTNESIAFKTAKTSSLNKENRTPSFRLPTRRTSKIHSIPKKSN